MQHLNLLSILNNLQFETLISPRMEGTVHHLTLYGCNGNPRKKLGRYVGEQWDCYDQTTNMPIMPCSTAIFGWAVGAEVFSFTVLF